MKIYFTMYLSNDTHLTLDFLFYGWSKFIKFDRQEKLYPLYFGTEGVHIWVTKAHVQAKPT